MATPVDLCMADAPVPPSPGLSSLLQGLTDTDNEEDSSNSNPVGGGAASTAQHVWEQAATTLQRAEALAQQAHQTQAFHLPGYPNHAAGAMHAYLLPGHGAAGYPTAAPQQQWPYPPPPGVPPPAATAPPAAVAHAAFASERMGAFSAGAGFPHAAAGGTAAAHAGSRRGRKPKPRLPDLQSQLDALNAQYQRLSSENGFLRNKLKALERVVPYRDLSLGFLAEVSSISAAQEQAAAAAAAVAARSASAECGTSAAGADSPSTTASAGAPAAAAAAAAAAAVPLPPVASPCSSGDLGTRSSSGLTTGAPSNDAAAAARPGAANAAAAGATAAGDARARLGSALDANGPLRWSHVSVAGPAGVQPPVGVGAWAQGPPVHPEGTLAAVQLCPSPDGDVPPITPAAIEALRKTTPADFRVAYKHIVQTLAVLTAAAEAMGPSSPQHARLERFLNRAMQYWDRVTLLSPMCFVANMHVNLETGQEERAGDDFYDALARSIHPTDEQLDEIATLEQVFRANVQPVLQERAQLVQQLGHRLAATLHSIANPDMAALSEVDELAQKLQRNTLAEHAKHWDIGDFLVFSVLAPLQVAKALAASYPYVPDGVAVMHALLALRARRQQELSSKAAA